MEKNLQPKQSIYYTPDYGMTGAMGRVVEVYKESKTVCLSLEENDYDFDSTVVVPIEHVHSQNFLDGW